MEITATETHRIGSSAHIQFTDVDGVDLLPGGRYVDAATWDADPESIIVQFAQELEERPEPEVITAPVKEAPVTMDDPAIAAKRKALDDAKAALLADALVAEENIDINL
jgi:hypothetical protein